MQIVGADVIELRALARRLDDAGSALLRTSAILTQQLTATRAWHGPDADRHRSAWLSQHQPALARTAAAMGEAARQVAQHADEQEQASAAEGGVIGTRSAATLPSGIRLADFPTSASLKAFIDTLRRDGVDPRAYAVLLEQYWSMVAAENAGIDLHGWDPGAGAKANLDNMAKSYDYYRELWRRDPRFQWAAFASLVGPDFAGGMLDLDLFKSLPNVPQAPMGGAPDWLTKPLMPKQLEQLDALKNISDEDLRYFETKFVGMQKAIFVDQMSMHEAYLSGGLAAIKEMQQSGLIDKRAYTAWIDIDSGDASRVARGNMDLLYREQHDVVKDSYDEMRNYKGDLGQSFTYLLGAIGRPSFGDAQGLAQYDPLSFGGTQSHLGVEGRLHVETSLPAHNVSVFKTRWDLIEHNTLPEFRKYIDGGHSWQLDTILDTPASARIDAARPINNKAEITERLTDFNVDKRIGLS